MVEASRVTVDRARACLLGGAIGDALGAPLEFLTGSMIRQILGGLPEVPGDDPHRMPYVLVPHGGAPWTDDTQMTLFTAEGLIQAAIAIDEGFDVDPCVLVHRAYLRWLITQGDQGVPLPQPIGWLLEEQALWSLRAPGSTCLGSLRSGQRGTVEMPLNDSKGCGGVMRMAPVGLVSDEPFQLGTDLAAITHGHPSGYYPAGALAAMVAMVVEGAELAEAVERVVGLLADLPGGDETATALQAAVTLAGKGRPTGEDIEQLGGGWSGDEALAIAVCAALAGEDFHDGVTIAVQHGGDSDSTGAICGNLLGAAGGLDAIPAVLIDQLQAADLITRVADELVAVCGSGEGLEDEDLLRRYG